MMERDLAGADSERKEQLENDFAERRIELLKESKEQAKKL